MKYYILLTLYLAMTKVCLGQVYDITLNSSESGDKLYQARNSITLEAGYSYTTGGGTLTAEIASLTVPNVTENVVFDSAINPDVYSIDTSRPVGKTPGVLNVVGSAIYSIPLDVPKGTAGLQPSLSLNYLSNFADGSLGIGWNVGGLSTIHRINRTIYHDDESDPIRGNLGDKYALDGVRLIKTSGTYGYSNSEYRTEIDQFSKVIANGYTGYGPESFKVYTKSGLIYEYGSSDNSRLKKSNGCILSWKLDRITDRFGNFMIFTYLDTDNEHPIWKIEYTFNNGQMQGVFSSITFNYKNRSDVSRYYYGGEEYTRNILLDNIVIVNNGQNYKTYELNYSQDTFAQLLKVTEKVSAESLNPTVFAWTDQTEQYIQSSHYSNSSDEYYFHGDFNGDGRTDFVTVPKKTSYSSSDKWKLYLADSNGDMIYKIQGDLNSYFELFIVKDFNGDGLTDLMMQEDHSSTYSPDKRQFYYYESNGISFSRSSSYYYNSDIENLDIVDYNGDGKLEFLYHNSINSWFLYTYSGQSIYSASIPSFGEYYVVDIGMHNRIVDFNGDGCSDLLVLFNDSYKIYEFKGGNDVLVETESGTNIENNDFLLFGDFNGDGTTDIIKEENTSGANWSLLHLGNDGFEEYDLTCFDNFSINIYNNRIYARELDGDGRTDVVLIGRGESTSNSYNRINVALSTGNDFNITEYVSSTTMNNGYDRYFHFGDYNGDGRNQLFYKYYSTSKLYSFATGTPSHLVSDIINGFGARTKISYLPMSNSSVYTRGTSATYPIIDFSSSMQLVSQVETDNGIGGMASMSYEYEGAKIHRKGKGFLGFKKVTATNNETGIYIETHNDFNTTFFYPELKYVYTKKGATSISTVSNTWNTTDYGDKRIFPYISSSSQVDDLKGLSVITTSSYDSYGNPTSIVKNYGGGLTQTVTYQYNDERVSDWLIGRPTTITNTSVKGTDSDVFTTSRTYFTWNNHPDVDEYNTGNPAYWKLDREYDAKGNLWKEHKVTAGLSQLTTVYEYDANGVNLTKVTSPTGDDVDYTHYSVSGLLHTKTDRFGNVVTNNYTSSYQLSSIIPSDGISVAISSSYDSGGGPLYACYYVTETRSDGGESKKWFDKLGREIRNENKSFGGVWLKKDMQYNNKGQLYNISEPATGTPSEWNTTSFDSFGRVSTIIPRFGASSSTVYNGIKTTSTINSRVYTIDVNSAGQIIERTDPGGTISYEYHPNGTLKSTTAPGSAITTMTYDKNGNRLTIDDPSAGVVSNTYYGSGQIKTQTSARGNTVVYVYQPDGLLDKLITSEGEIDYTYNSDNLVSTITSPGGVIRTYTYDSNGRTSSITESIGAESNMVFFEYDTKGRLWKKYFNGTTDYEEYAYDSSSGVLSEITFNGVIVWEITGMDEYNRVTNANIGNISCTWSHDSNQMLEQINANNVQQYDYLFNVDTKNLQTRTNYLKTLSESFTYDELDRLTGVSGDCNLTMDYLNNNNNGNINFKSDAGTYLYDGASPYAVSNVVGYKNIDETTQDIEYYSFEKVKKITQGTKTADFEYSSDYQRIKMVLKDNGTTTKTRYYFGTSCEKEIAGSTTTQYIWIGGSAYSAVAVAKRVGTGSWTVYNVFRDHLGTITHFRNASTGIVEEYNFDAWGRRRDKDSWSYTLTSEPDLFADRGFTGHEHLDDFGLINMNGRLYDPIVGRFLSPDSHVQSADFSQGYNRYGYCLNNPLVYIDEDGDFFWIAVAIGAIVNTTMQAINGNINSVGDFFIAAGVGALGGAAAAIGGGAAMSLMNGYGLAGTMAYAMAGSTGLGFASGMIVGASAGFAGGLVTGAGNSWASGAGFGEGLMEGLKIGSVGALSGGVIGGLAGGIAAHKQGANFWTGKMPIPKYTTPVLNYQVESQSLSLDGTLAQRNNLIVDSHVEFDGETLSWINTLDDETTQVVDSWDAISGPYGNGALPDGNYIGNNLRVRTESSYVREGVGFSVDLTPQFQTTRTLLRIHPDGGILGTEGCIGILGNATRLTQLYNRFNRYFNRISSDIRLVVN